MTAPARPRVMLVDDHAAVLTATSEILSADCDVVAALTDARQALDAAMDLHPDVVVLDIAMPDLDGFQVARALSQLGSRSEIVFLSMHRGDDYIEEGFDSGAQGYVLKTRLRTDLSSAIHHALAGRIFVPSLSAISALAPRGGHVLQLYTDFEAAAVEGARLAATALRRGDLVVLETCAETRATVLQWLDAHDVDVKGAGPRLREGDPAAFLRQTMEHGQPQPDGVREMVDALDHLRISIAGPDSRLTLFGDISGQLCEQGRFEEGLALERMWNRATSDRLQLTVCSHRAEYLRDGELMPHVCTEHWAICHTGHA